MRVFLTIMLLLISALSAQAEQGQAFYFYVENDTRRLGGPGSDNAYTNGIRASYVSADNHVPPWANSFLNSSDTLQDALKTSETNFSISVAQQIFTPNNTGSPNLIINDRPYAAWLYVGFAAQFKDEIRSHAIELDVGLVGPEAGGQTVQNGYHRIFGIDLTQGWDYQLHTEPTLQLSYQQRQKILNLHSDVYQNYLDVIPFFGASLGNVFINAHAGAMLRIGTNLPNDFGPTRASSPEGNPFVEPARAHDEFREVSLYGFVGGRVEAVAHNMFLDGNTFRPSHHVHKFPFVLETEFGFGALWSHWGATWQFVTRSPEFEERKDVNSFASISVSYSFE